MDPFDPFSQHDGWPFPDWSLPGDSSDSTSGENWSTVLTHTPLRQWSEGGPAAVPLPWPFKPSCVDSTGDGALDGIRAFPGTVDIQAGATPGVLVPTLNGVPINAVVPPVEPIAGLGLGPGQHLLWSILTFQITALTADAPEPQDPCDCIDITVAPVLSLVTTDPVTGQPVMPADVPWVCGVNDDPATTPQDEAVTAQNGVWSAPVASWLWDQDLAAAGQCGIVEHQVGVANQNNLMLQCCAGRLRLLRVA